MRKVRTMTPVYKDPDEFIRLYDIETDQLLDSYTDLTNLEQQEDALWDVLRREVDKEILLEIININNSMVINTPINKE